MKCPICKHGTLLPGTATVTLDRSASGAENRAGGTTIVFKNVPAIVCTNCGEEFTDESITASLLKQANDAANSGIQVEVRSFAA